MQLQLYLVVLLVFGGLECREFDSFSGDAVGFICIWSAVLFVTMTDVVAIAAVGKLSTVAFVDGFGAIN